MIKLFVGLLPELVLLYLIETGIKILLICVELIAAVYSAVYCSF